ncbi:FAD dependent oxidoreductase [Streptomyces mobaraensis NBRC 13819 = DSM 40847]|uniref:FAD dependent oxidoreductase n=1 Tax=Streptomyces mobaraensis (strain ATCC 29032 / DSM 40847 / JCM 4168 / NBRC 13819 / NCIMB 11159 / IPCR 16-22) TaxID=1223523 RepID=M3BNR1_STRM1|nr:FAD-dependent oxidoreductase [Streptomyces mobaraensis]EMF01280.1 FAD dependent oxidoreductase [Streptomyces mobaraensis NBRC 13819 = DSM 40847]
MTEPVRHATDVVVVGAGPVGLALAVELRLGGARVTVLERLPAPTGESRASTLHARTMELLDQRGLSASLGAPSRQSAGHYAGLPLDLSGQPSPYAGQWKVPQTRLEALLAERAAALGADVRRGHDVRGLRETGDRVEVEAVAGGRTVRCAAAYAVGCDGERSTVAALAGFRFTGSEAGRELLRCDLTGVTVPDRRFERLPGGLAVAATRDGVTRIMVHEHGRAPAARPGAPEFAEVAAAWRRVTGEDVTAGTPLWVNAFGDASLQADHYRRGRILLAGDAAHRQLPVGGQALNLGLQDAANLGWKLAAAACGRAPAGLLDTYHDERHPVGRTALDHIAAQALLLLGGPEVDAVREILGELLGHRAVRDRLAARAGGLDVRYGPDDGHPLTGTRLTPADLTRATGTPEAADLLRRARGVLLDLSGDPRRADGLADLAGDRVGLVTGRTPVGAETVLLRPDGHVAWAGDRTADPRPALERWFGGAGSAAAARGPAAARTTAAARGPAEAPGPTAKERNSQVDERGGPMPSKLKEPGRPAPSGPPRPCDVLILGSGLAGTVSAAILARQGAEVVLVDAAQHPRFAIGESMTPQLVEWLHILKSRFDVPEIGHLLDTRAVHRNLGPRHGRKQSFGFIRHEPGAEPDPEEATMFVIPRILTQASHLYRQDTDQHFFNIAARYGCVTRQNWRARDLDFDDDGVTVTGQNGEVFRARYLIDASGFRSPLAEKFDLREDPCRFKHHSRSLFTHYVGVKPFDEVSHHPRSLRPPASWHAGTLHHMIERGWFWIIPFDNVKGSTNPLCSVGLTIDPRRYPKPRDLTPEEEFDSFLERYPAVRRQFAGARRVREWVSTERLQYSSKRSIGHRWCLMSHAAGFIDPLFSRGLSNTFEVVYSLCTRIVAALRDDDWSEERFGYVEELERGLLRRNDELVNSSFIAFEHFRLWNAVFRVWAGWLTPGAMRLYDARARYEADGDERHLTRLETVDHPGLWWPEPEFKNVLELTAEVCEKYESGTMTGDEAADAVFAALDGSESLNPVFGFKDDESTRFVYPSTATVARFVHWAARTCTDTELRDVSRSLAAGAARSLLKGRKPL